MSSETPAPPPGDSVPAPRGTTAAPPGASGPADSRAGTDRPGPAAGPHKGGETYIALPAATAAVHDGASLTVRPRPSRLADHYVTGDRIGEGGMGFVVSAFDRTLGRVVALKITRDPAQVCSDDAVRRFLAEAQITGQLEHPNIVPVHEAGEDLDGNLYFSMKRVEGITLADLVDKVRAEGPARHDYSVTRALHIMLKVCDGVAFAHSRGVLHRDLKPSNVMIGAFGEVLVVDWGLAKTFSGTEPPVAGAPAPIRPSVPPREDAAFSANAKTPIPSQAQLRHTRNEVIQSRVRSAASSSSVVAVRHALTQVGTVMGTLEYMPPEQALGHVDEMDQRSDVYSLGAVLYEMMTLVPPFMNPSDAELVRQLVQGQLIPPRQRVRQARQEMRASPTRLTATHAGEGVKPTGGGATPATSWQLPNTFHHGMEIPREVEAIILKAMAVDPKDRYASAEALRRDVLNFLDGLPVAACPDSLPRRLGKWLRRHPTLLATAVTSGILLLVAGAAAFGLFRAQERERYQLLEEKWRAEADAAESARKRTEVLEEQRKRDLAHAEAYAHYIDAMDAQQNRRPIARILAALEAATQADPTFTDAWIMMGGQLALSGDLKGCLAAYTRAEQLHAEQGHKELQARVLYLIGQVRQYSMNDWQGALYAYQKLAALAPEHVYGHIGQAFVLALQGKNEAAQERVEAALRQGPDYFEAHYIAGFLYGQRTGALTGKPNPLYDFGRALAEFDRAIELRRDFADLYSNRATLLLDTGETDKADADLRRALELNPNCTHAHTLIGVLRRQQGRLEESLEAYNRLEALLPGRAETWFNRAYVYYSLGRLEESLADYDRFVQAYPDHPSGHARRAVVRVKLGDLAGAREDLRFALRRNNSVAEIYADTANLPIEGGSTALARELLNEGIDRYPQDANLLLRRALVEAIDNDEKAATEDVAAFVRLAGGGIPALLHAGQTLYGKQFYRLASRCYEQVLERDPRHTDALFYLGGCYFSLGDYRSSIQAFDRLLAIKPDDLEGLMYRGSAWREQGDLDQSQRDLDAAVLRSPPGSEAHFQRGVLRTRQEQFEGAVGDLDRFIAAHPRDNRGWYHRGVSRIELGLLDAAEADLRQAAALGYQGAWSALARLARKRGQEDLVEEALTGWVKAFPAARAEADALRSELLPQKK